MKLTKERRNEIAWKLIVEQIKGKGLSHLKPNEFQRQVINSAKTIGVSTEEAMEFTKTMVMPLVEAMFVLPKKKHDDGHNFRDGVEG